MSRIFLLGLATLLLVAGVILLVTRVARDTRSQPPALSKSLGSERDKEFQSPADWMTEYTLVERSGRKFDSRQLRGKVHIVNFFFTACPTACPLQTQKVQELDREFGPQGVYSLSISCDPERDTPVVLSQYADRYHADPDRWVFLTGDFDYIRRVAAEVYYSPLPQRMAHREDLVVVDKWGNVRGNFPWNDSAQIASMKQLLRELLAETEAPPAARGDDSDALEVDSEDASDSPAGPAGEASAAKDATADVTGDLESSGIPAGNEPDGVQQE